MEVTWNEYSMYIHRLERKLRELGMREKTNQLVCLGRGGFMIGDAFSRMWNLPLAVLMTSSYSVGDNLVGKKTPDFRIAKHFSSLNHLGEKVLILDDMLDTGESMGRAIDRVRHELINIQDADAEEMVIRSAVLWSKDKQKVSPVVASTYFVELVRPDIWIVQPFEIDFEPTEIRRRGSTGLRGVGPCPTGREGEK